MKLYTDKELVTLFNAAEKTLFENTELPKTEFKKVVFDMVNIDTENWDEEDFFTVMVRVTFYSGFKATTVTNKLQDIQLVFKGYKRVAKCDGRKIQEIIDGGKVINHRRKIQGIIENANEIIRVKKEFGSFKNYLASFGNSENDEVLFNIITDLKKRFSYLGRVTVFHFLTDIGFFVLKPDRVLCRIFTRLGLVDTEKDEWGVISAGRRIAKATKKAIRYIDMVFVIYGQIDEKKELGLKNGICLEKKPECQLCHMYEYCIYKGKKKLK